MSIKLSQIKDRERTVSDFMFAGETIEFTYRVGAYTSLLETTLDKTLKEGLPGNSTSLLLADMIITWDVLNDDGTEYEPTLENIQALSIDFQDAVLSRIGEENRVSREEIKNSGAGSGRVAKSGHARRGTR